MLCALYLNNVILSKEFLYVKAKCKVEIADYNISDAVNVRVTDYNV